jgi:hypothetical protein
MSLFGAEWGHSFRSREKTYFWLAGEKGHEGTNFSTQGTGEYACDIVFLLDNG